MDIYFIRSKSSFTIVNTNKIIPIHHCLNLVPRDLNLIFESDYGVIEKNSMHWIMLDMCIRYVRYLLSFYILIYYLVLYMMVLSE